MLISLLTALSGRLGLCARPLLVSAKPQMPQKCRETRSQPGPPCTTESKWKAR